ncbi:Putative penicillin-binding protein 1A [Bradyrhizobium sp. ORS 278]|uniref:transglycosylase domain-containing protein n=1 Tax=Bradyrhizobium sp. (strain ORS 278) TaxID=114615 RepID=UPI0001507E88|nr:transglycosylase domain-containing protein [Bradyrhizobium sp. ORS 278]CAL76407.1 Putative penicillin-binding protein 1A [Bradyrhizobium sp. ORS 278]
MHHPRTRRFLILFGKSILAVLSLAVMLLLYAAGYAIWYAEYHLGVPTEAEIAALPGTGHLCPLEAGSPYMPLADMPPLLRQAVVASTGSDFQTRPNLVLPALLAAVVKSDGRPDTRITFAVTRHCLHVLASDCCRGLDWHIGSTVFMGRLERTLSRDRILESYLNDSYLGRNAYGVAAAATAHFGKPLTDLDIGEIALLIARFQVPTPSERDSERRSYILDKMLSAGLIDEAQASAAKATPLSLIAAPPHNP